MKLSRTTRTFTGLLALLLVAALPAVSQAADPEAAARALLAELVARQFEKAAARFDETVSQLLPPPKLEESWDSLVGQVGAFQEVTGARRTEQSGLQIVILTIRFQHALIEMRVGFDAQGRVAGLNSGPAQSPTSAWRVPAYVNAEKFDERNVTVGSGQWALPGKLTLPKGKGPFPAAVLVHGSGPNDEDESVGPTKVFKDLAWGLASRGIAVLRYPKRTRHHAAALASVTNFTVKEETVEDASLAVDLLATQPEVNPRGIFVIGHSLGATLAPRIAALNPRVAGLVLLAGASRPLEVLLVEQVEYVTKLDGTISEFEQKQIDAVHRTAAQLRDPELKPDSVVDVLGAKIPGSYFLDLRGYRPADAAAALKLPVLILHGERDYQVVMADFDVWKQAFAGRTDATLKSYPALNHLFIAGSGPGRPAEYSQPGNLAPEVLEDIAQWILRTAPSTAPKPAPESRPGH